MTATCLVTVAVTLAALAAAIYGTKVALSRLARPRRGRHWEKGREGSSGGSFNCSSRPREKNTCELVV